MKSLLLALACAGALAQQPPARILVAYDSRTGNTEKLARAIRDGAASVEGVQARLVKTADFKFAETVQYDGIVVGTPVHWSDVSAEARRFVVGVGEALWQAKSNGEGRTAGAFCTGGHPSMGKDVARLSILAAFLTMRFVAVGGVESQGYGTLGPEATTGPADPGISDKELEEARHYGERFARVTLRVRAGRVYP